MVLISEFILWILGIILLPIAWRYFQKRRQWTALINKIPGPKGVPLFGNTLQILTSRENHIKAARAILEPYTSKYPMVRVWAGPFPIVLLTKAESAKVLLSSNKHINKAVFYKYLRCWIGDGLLTSTGSKWQHRRKLLTPSFHFKILENFLLVMNEQANILVKMMQNHSQKINDGEFDIYPFITRCTLDIICETAMGQGIKAQLNADSQYLNAVNELTMLIRMRMNKPWLSPDWIFKRTSYGKRIANALEIVHGFTNKIIKMKRENLKTVGNQTRNDDDALGIKRRVALLDLLLEEPTSGDQPLTDEDIREEVDTFMFEGHDTTAVGISWALYCIGQLPEMQQKMFDELNSIFGDSDRDPTTEDLHNMKYIELVLKEALRVFPPVPAYARSTVETLEICGYEIPPNVTVVISPHFVHRDPAYYPDPDEFKPERFLAENSQNRDPYAFLPFSAGLRNCIGQRFAVMEEKTVISRILRSFIVTSITEKDIMSNIIGELVLRPIRGIKVKLQPRTKV